jgi:hypothetical protein
MKAIIVRYMNEVVSLTILALMSTALIVGQVDAVADAATPKFVPQDARPAMVHAEFAIDLRLGEMARLHIDKASIKVMREILDTRLERND